jgi:serine/threonine-protein kinase
MHVTEQIDEVADRFEAAWKSGNAPLIEAYLEEGHPEARMALLVELIRIDAAVRSRRGEDPQLDEYLARFPELGRESDTLRELSDYWNRLATVHDVPASTGVALPLSHAAPQASPPEQSRIGRFLLLDRLGDGSFGTVWRAYDDRLDRYVAVKMLRGAAIAGSEQRSRFLREARSVAQFRHESIVAVHEAGEHDGVPYLVSELIRGKSLRERVTERRFTPRESAQMVAAVARALDYAHRHGVVHRDVKPSNILLDEADRPFLTDFGLAKRAASDVTMTSDGQVLGTPAYMSPEQAAGNLQQLDHRTDVYSLGTVLYELLTRERPFRGEVQMLLRQIREDEPRPPRRLDDAIPRDLETICLKAMAKEPSGRYQTAGELADDLERFLRGEPVHARPDSSWGRGVRYCRRNWNVVVPSGLALVAMVTVAVTAAVAWITSAELRVAHAQQQEQTQRREVLVERLQRLRLRERTNGWSRVASEIVAQAARIRRDPDLRDFAAATLEGLDAQVVKQLRNVSASSVAFDAKGERLLLGAPEATGLRRSGGEPHDAQPSGKGEDVARLYTRRTGQTRFVGVSGPGPVTFTPKGRPLQLAIRAANRLELHDLTDSKLRQTFLISNFTNRDPVTESLHKLPLATITPDGTVVAAAVRISEDQGILTVWDATTGGELRRWDHSSSAIALAPDGTVVAAGDDMGRITLWSIADGREITTLQCSRNKITALAFQANPRRALVHDDPKRWSDPWLLSAGEYGGVVTIWNPMRGVPVAICRGGSHWISSVTFSPDATLVAAGTHSAVLIWDVATGQLLLRVYPPMYGQGDTFQWVSGLAFTPDMSRLAVSSEGMYSPPVATVLELQNGRGIRTLRGLSADIAKIHFSPDDRLVAALSHRWEIGIWRVSDGRLLRIIDAPEGFSTDNAALVISPDGRHIAYSAFRDARLWEIETGRQIAAWRLPPGLQDELAFTTEGSLLGLRFETRSRDDMEPPLPPLDNADPREFPRVCRVRRLLLAPQDRDGMSQSALVREFHDFDRHVSELIFAPDGTYFAAVGRNSRDDATVKAFDVTTGEALWSKDAGGLGDSRSGPIVALPAADGRSPLFELPTGDFLFRSPPSASVIGNGRRLAAGGWRQIGDDHLGRTVYHIGDDEPFITLGIDRPMGAAWVQFSLDETLLAWAHPDGTLQIADLPAIQRALAPFGLGW